jgi:hypothetical protein
MDSAICKEDRRRDAVRRQMNPQGQRDLNGIDYLEVDDDQVTLTVYFLGKLPAHWQKNRKELARHVRIEGGRRIRDIKVEQVEPQPVRDPELDDTVIVRLDKPGDFSTYTLRLVGLPEIDPHYDHVDFSFKVNCPGDLDCLKASVCAPPERQAPEINYLAKDYASFRQLLLDRLALVMPDWQERHVPDLGSALVELLAYAGDYLSYYQDAVATEAYLDTARQRISVRRHARLMDYQMHEGCNARTWVCIETDTDLPPMAPEDLFFIAGQNAGLPAGAGVLTEDDLRGLPADAYEVFEPLLPDRHTPICIRAAHSEISFYTWGGQECCLPPGAQTATLVDKWVYVGEAGPATVAGQKPAQQAQIPPLGPTQLARKLDLHAGDVLIFEEMIGLQTGAHTDADPTHRHAVRLTRAQPAVDPVITTELSVDNVKHRLPTPVVEIEWAEEDKLPFPLCISMLMPPPDCRHQADVSIARGNAILVDHGRTIRPPECLGRVPVEVTQAHCESERHPSDVTIIPGRFRPRLGSAPLTFAQPLPGEDALSGRVTPAAHLLAQDPRQALPQISLAGIPPAPDGRGPLFAWRDIEDPVELLRRLQTQQDASRASAEEGPSVAALRRRLPRPIQDGLARGSRDSAGLVEALRNELRHLLSRWDARLDLLSSAAQDRHFVVEIDNDGNAHLRFGDGEVGQQPAAGATFYATYRMGNGARGNVGAEAISHMVLRHPTRSGACLWVRNPLPAQGPAAEPVAEARLFAPAAFRKTLARAITAADYAALAERNPGVQRAAARLTWTGSWYEANVAIDPRSEGADRDLLEAVATSLYPYRRMGHDLRSHAPQYVSLDIALEVCVLPGYLRGHVKAALLDVFSNRTLPAGGRGFFHPDNLTFGAGIYLSQLVAAAQAVPGVESVQVTRLQRQFETPDFELENGVLPLGPLEIARLDNDPSYPEHGKLTLDMQGGR